MPVGNVSRLEFFFCSVDTAPNPATGSGRQLRYGVRWSSLMGFEDGPEEFDYRGDSDEDHGIRPEVADVVEHLRDTLTHDMAMRMIPNRFGVTPANDDELERLMEELIVDAYNDGYDSWDHFPY